MKLDYSQTLLSPEGKPFSIEVAKDVIETLTIGKAFQLACNAPLPGDDALGLMDRYAIGEIGAIVAKGLDLSTEQVSKVKERCGKILNPAACYALVNAIEAAPVKPMKPGKPEKK